MSQPKPARYAKPNGELIKSMLTTPPEEDGPFYAVNLMKYREHADYADGRSTALSGRQADDQYAPIDVLTRIGAEIVFIADVEQQTAGDDIVWDRIGIVRYPTRRSMIEMNMRDDFQKTHAHKEAGMASTIVMLCEGEGCPAGPGLRTKGDMPRPLENPPRVVMHVSRNHRDAQAPASAAFRPEVNLNVVGTILGDGREWNRVRMTRFENDADLSAASAEDAWIQAERSMGDASEERYSMVLRVHVDWWAEART